MIELRAGNLTIHDLGSTNGTFVNDVQVSRHSLVPGDVIRLGGVPLDLVTGSNTQPDSGYYVETPPIGNGDSFNRLTCDSRLTDAEHRVLRELLRGLKEREIADTLCVSYNTVHTHVRDIYQTFEVRSRAQLMALYISRSDGESPGARLTAKRG